MLGAPPPGYNVGSINNQQPTPFSIPGAQGGTAQGYTDPFKSSFSAPSSYAVPSSVNAPNPWFSQPQQQNPLNAMVRALRGGR